MIHDMKNNRIRWWHSNTVQAACEYSQYAMLGVILVVTVALGFVL